LIRCTASSSSPVTLAAVRRAVIDSGAIAIRVPARCRAPRARRCGGGAGRLSSREGDHHHGCALGKIRPLRQGTSTSKRRGLRPSGRPRFSTRAASSARSTPLRPCLHCPMHNVAVRAHDHIAVARRSEVLLPRRRLSLRGRDERPHCASPPICRAGPDRSLVSKEVRRVSTDSAHSRAASRAADPRPAASGRP